MKLYEPDIETETATFGMQCFWGSEACYGSIPGVIRTKVGYTGGIASEPNYQKVGDHTESVQIQYDPKVTSYEKLLEVFWNGHDPTESRKRQYMSAIFYHNEEQKKLAQQTMEKAQKNYTKPIATEILPAEAFYNAEDYHQKYMLQKHPILLENLELTGKDLIESHVATRLNGYLSSYGSLEAFEEEWEQLGLNEDQATYVRNEMKRRAQSKTH